MCGICGRLNFNQRPVADVLVRAMNQRLVRRGPDEEGFFFSADKTLGMAMRRLKIIDLSTGQQPIFNETKDVCVILNGEIYNYLELRADLQKKGHVFATQSDTEVLVHAYEVYGIDFLQRLNGMFAIALWDDKNKILILARDRMGIKPLYVRRDSTGISFASEIKALLADPDCSKAIDPFALDDYFSLLYVPGPRSIFKAIQKLSPGNAWVCDASKKTVQQIEYWKHPLVSAPKNLGWRHYEEQLDSLLNDSVRMQLRSDVPNGLFLSSGLDSSTIAYYAARHAGHKMKSFTIDFNESSYSESRGADLVARQFGFDHHTVKMQENPQDLVLQTADYFDEPLADTSAIPTYLLCQFTRKMGVTVTLSGEGGDELFAGYPTYLATQWAPVYRALPQFLRTQISNYVKNVPVSWDRLTWGFKLREFVRGAENSEQRSHFAWKEIFTETMKKNLYTAEFLHERSGHDSFESFDTIFKRAGSEGEGSRIALEKLLYVDQQTYLLDQFLVKSDRMSMANSLEVRVPILDHRIVEFAAQVPSQYKLRGMTTKWAMRELMKNKLPREIVSGAKKGFSPPVPYWIAGTLKQFILENLSIEKLESIGFLRPEIVQRYLQEHFECKQDHHRRIWALLNFVLWYERWAR